MSEITGMCLKEFVKFGYLQEVNRQFFHPLGLALSMAIDDETGDVDFAVLYDARYDPHGVVFSGSEIDIGKARRVEQEQEKRGAARKEYLGFVVQPALGWEDTP